MSRINTNVNALIAQRILRANNRNLAQSLERLSTGFRINRASDDPAGLIASENLRAEKSALSAAIGNAQRAEQVTNIMEGGLQEISTLLQEVQGLIGQNASEAGLSTEEKETNQLQIDQIIQAIDSIASNTTFNGVKLLNGSHDFQVAAVDGNVADFQVHGAKFVGNTSVDVNMVVTQSAQHAGLFMLLGAAVDTGGNDPSERLIFELAGAKGTREFSFGSGTAIASVAGAINQLKDATGVSAVASGTYLELKSTEYGSDQFVSVELKDTPPAMVGSLVRTMDTNENFFGGLIGDLTTFTAPVRDTGQDIGAVVNGITASGNGLTASVSSGALDVSVTLDTAAGGATTVGSLTAFSITGGGAKFNLGPQVNISNQVRMGVGNMASRNLGSVANGFLDELGAGQGANIVTGNLDTAQQIADDAISYVSQLRGRIGAFQSYKVGSAIRSMSVGLENLTAAESAIRDTDFAVEMSNLVRNQILVQATLSVLSIANANPQNVLALLQPQ